MTIKVRYFASLREQMGKSEECWEFEAGLTIHELWQRLNPGIIRTDSLLIALNHEYCHADQLLEEGDEVAFFPPVTGG